MNNERDIKPDNGARAATDPRIVYGAGCVWWDSINNAGRSRSGLPGCPHCGSVLFEVPSALVWWTNVDDYAERTNDREYRAFVEWLRGKCRPNIDAARLEYKLETLSRKHTKPRSEP